MSEVEKVEIQDQPEKVYYVQLNMVSSNVKELEEFATVAGNKFSALKTKKGPVRLPTKTLKITTRKTPNGEGSKTWETYELKVHKRYITGQIPASAIVHFLNFTVPSSVTVSIQTKESSA
ncbi:hypothetical protein FOG51_02313 [Hanseniaspora uvarum]|jgi:small subunit ribosomal protein S20e|uniref:40S ribosomal protein S20 n=1 Tax=Hanseniaspora uvarum TaxID=29833 RepID=A0A1E5S030_HANUV|nr:hypothetical protein FOG48_03923 [Hanseniaspora uvarum]KAF0272589.1 hypothetical protein FOG51_02313 [Hanseniaspora uvarum]KKA01847.1 40S ribosomal protein S20 [Hanseniaspora uvarum DSM 2768]OEJ92590.1 40S ribosomal protein S20 [Hanseniaspora uvarum]GMM40250.1 ribosomal 40S subunit protein S20 [Hanseniaspora uvarum]